METKTTTSLPPKLLDQVREKIRYKHYSLSTENTYVSWIKQYILFNDKRHPSDIGAAEVEVFLKSVGLAQHRLIHEFLVSYSFC